MKKLCIVLLAMIAFIVPMKGQEQIVEEIPMPDRAMPKDSLPDLWIVTIDFSGSMKEPKTAKSIEEKRFSKVYKRFDNIITKSGIDVGNADFVLLSSGMSADELRSSTTDSFTSFMIRPLSNRNNTWEVCDTVIIMNLSQVSKAVKAISKGSSYFQYARSFASIARPLSIYCLAKKRHFDFSLYRNIYHVLITDNGDDYDQWDREYSFLRLYYKNHLATLKTEILPLIACSNFDFFSKESGKFEEKACIDTLPYAYLTQYTTYQEVRPEPKVEVGSLVFVSDFHDHQFTLQMKPCGDSVNFVYVDTCRVNGHAVPVNRYLYLDDTIVVQYDKTFAKTFQNEVAVEGSYQEIYMDRILGLRYRKVAYDGKLFGFFIPEETKAVERQYAWTFLFILLAIIAFILIWRECVVLSIFVNGKCLRIRRKAMNKLKNDDFTLATVIFDEGRLADVLFYKGCGMKVVDHSSTKPSEDKLLVNSYRGLSPNYPNVIYEQDQKGKNITIEFEPDNIGDKLQFSYADRLSHNLIIKFEEKETIKLGGEDIAIQSGQPKNDLGDCNRDMLARYYEQKAGEIKLLCNNVQVNIIRRTLLGEQYKMDYAILNIYDLNSSNAANHIFLRYSLMSFFDSNKMPEAKATELLIAIARHVLGSEGQKIGFIEECAYTNLPSGRTGISVDVSPMLSYIYLHKKGKSRLAYSPFADGRPPLADGRPSMTSVAVKVFPNEPMTMLNLPMRYKHPELKINVSNKEVLARCYREKESMVFLGHDKVKFLNVEKDWSSGLPVGCYGGITFYSWSLDAIVSDINKKK